jgi:hypothetical protein
VRPPEFGTLALAYLMHTHRERRLRAGLLRYGERNIAVTSVPWQLSNDKASEIIRAEEPTASSQPGDGAITPGRPAARRNSNRLDRARIDHTHTMR